MQPNYMTVMEIFSKQRRHTVPLFQRPYVWDREDEWEPLWDDIRDTAERVLNSPDRKIAAHFLGTAVLDHAPTSSSSIECREVIDGQQRLTTLQLALKAAIDAIGTLKAEDGDEEAGKDIGIATRQLEPLIANPGYAEDEERYKVWPTNEDRATFRDVMDSNVDRKPIETHSRMARAHAFFLEQFRNWLAGGRPGVRARALANGLKDHMKLIVLDLDDADEPQAIFETLNAHGQPLLPSDLIKNWLLWEGTRQGVDIERLYSEHWREFDHDRDYWHAKVGTGHAARVRLDLFLQHWLTLHLRKPVPLKHLYSLFGDFVAPTEEGDDESAVQKTMRRQDGTIDVEALMQDITVNADRFKVIERTKGETRFDVFLQRLQVLDIVVFHPLILRVMGHPASDAADRDTFAEALESYLVRRMVIGRQTRGYGTLALQLLDRIADLPDGEVAAPRIIAALASLEGTLAWPQDEELKTEWVRRQFYGQLRRSRLVMILRAIEEQYQREATKSEPVHKFNFDALEVEHIMPQAWEKHWKLPEGVDRNDRDWAIDGLGNLTLVSSPLNKELSNAPWITEGGKPSKSVALRDHSKLELTAHLLKGHPKCWDEGTIKTRALALFETATLIWPHKQN